MTKTKVLLALLLISVPFTVFIGSMVFVNRAYLAVSALVMAEVILIFLVLFEKRRPQAEFVVMVSFLCAIAVAGRIVFFAIPQFKPIGAVIIITAAAFGGETGFFVGAVSLLVSNMFFGQGPWTPWQMLTFGLMGFIAGSIFEKGLLKPSRLTMMILGGVLTVVIYGGIINPASVIMYNSEPTKSMFIFAYAAGIPFDVIHAASTMFFIWILGESFLKKIERVKKKYELDM